MKPRTPAVCLPLFHHFFGTTHACLVLGIALIASLSARAADHPTAHGYQEIKLPVPSSGKTGFILMSPEQTGLSFSNYVSAKTSREHQTVINAGLAVADIDGDGLPDLYFCRMDGGNALYKNLGNWKFQEITDQAGVACKERHSMGAAFADVNGDGAPDLLVLGYGGPNSLFINDGKGHFTEDMSFPGRSSTNGSISAAFADIDGNGSLDLYIANHRYHTIKEMVTEDELNKLIQPEVDKIGLGQKPSQEFLDRFTAFTRLTGFRVQVEDVQENGELDELYINDGKGHFTRVTQEKDRFKDENGIPIGMQRDWSLGVQMRDINGDGSPDIYTCSDFWTPDRLWLNDGTGHFRLAPKFTQRHQSNSSMGVDFADINRDGHVDFMTCEMLSRDHERQKRQMGVMRPTPIKVGVFDDMPQIMQNCLFLNRGDNTFAEIAMHAGVKASEWSWSPIFMDVDLDGYEDILVSTGTVRDNMDSDVLGLIKKNPPKTIEEYRAAQMLFPELHTQNFIFRNRHNLTFEDVSEQWGFKGMAVSGGMVVADLDGDGDLDVVINTIGSPAQIYRNETIAPRVAVQLKGLAPNTQGIGAKLQLTGGPVIQTQEIIDGGHYASCSQPMRVFAAGNAGSMKLEVTWRNGKQSVVDDVKPNCLYVVDETGATTVPMPKIPQSKPMFEDVSAKLAHKHTDADFDDFRRQPLLPNRLSQLGPGIAWFDLNGDGHDDLIIAGGRTGEMGVFLSDGKGGFLPEKSSLFSADRDQTTVLGLKMGDGNAVLTGSANFESGLTNTPAALEFDLTSGGWSAGKTLPGGVSSSGPLALGDLNGDGTLDLFIGGRSIPGRYPVAASSKIYLNKNGQWELDEKNSALFNDLGLVSGAVIGDIDGDGSQDLIVALEWGPIRVFLNKNGTLTEATKEFELDKFAGWWNGVTLGDFDGDGRLDIAASNWGQNSKYEGTYDEKNPLVIYHGDFDQNGSYDIVEAYHDEKMGKLVPVRGLSCSSRAMPFVKQNTPTYKDFGQASCSDIYREKLATAQKVEAHYLQHTVFLNRGKTFQAVPLPSETQLTTAMGICVADFDGDGKEDLFLAQNFYAVQIETPRNDGGRGLLLKGDGRGNFTPISGQFSGLLIYGEQRGAAVCDFDHDGRPDLAVTQNGAETKLYHNTAGKPGLRVRLAGGTQNPTGVGAVMRLISGEKKGPARAVLAGSGYWSQDSAVQVLARTEAASKLWVRWPNGKETTSDVPVEAQEVTVSASGELKVAMR